VKEGRRAALVAWIAFGLIVASLTVNLLDPEVRARLGPDALLWPLVPISFALMGALIASRQPRNTIALLLFLPGISFAIPSEAYLLKFPLAPGSPSPLFLLTVWYQGWAWLLLIMPILMILLLFPTGRPPGPRWRWLIHVALGMSGALILLVTFARELEPAGFDLGWTVTNPIGFIPQGWDERYFLGPWFVALPALTLLCAVSLFVRFRRARAVERQQIKWLLFGGIVFTLAYIPSFFGGIFDGSGGTLWGILFVVGLVAIPTSIAIAILRHRLFDIDVIIRRTLQYGVLTGILVALYAGSVLLFQTLLGPMVGGADSPPVVIVTTLALVALFNPLRIRVQRFIDRRFFRSRVDAERALERFAALARSEVDLEQLRRALLGTVGETLHPERMGLWLRSGARVSEGGER
jgi:hypothetical protein